jgi:YD repeat-containing protein
MDTDTVYDSLGRVVLVTDPYPDAATNPTIYGTQTQYDAQGQAVKSIRQTGVKVTITNTKGLTGTQIQYNSVGNVSSITNAGTQLWQTQSLFDSYGRVTEAVAADSHVTDYEYDKLGRKTAEIGGQVSLADAGLALQDLQLQDGNGTPRKDLDSPAPHSLVAISISGTDRLGGGARG